MSDDEGSDGASPRLDAFRAIVDKYDIDLDDPVDSFDDYEAIEELDLSEKELEELSADIMEALPPNLKTLALEKNALIALPETFGQGEGSLPELKELYLRENQLEKLPAALKHLTSLESLYLEDNELTEDGIPPELSELAGSMLGLCLHRNKFTTLPVTFCKLTLLEELYLDGNMLEELPDELGGLVNLKELDILGNKLKSLPSSFKNLSKLEILHAENNQLAKLPKGLGSLVSLKKVYLQNNQLTKLHASLGRCTKLEVLNVEDNCLEKVAKRIGELPKLKHLLLANNRISELPFNPVERAPQLRRLTLSGNNLPTQVLELERTVAMAQVAEGDDEQD